MAAETTASQPLPEAVSTAVTAVADRLSAALGDRLGAVVLYGSLLRGGYRPRASDVNLLIILDVVRVADLTAVAGCLAAHAAVPFAPVVMTRDDLRSAAQCAPAAVWDMWDHHLVVHGADPLIGLRIELADLARQLRAELRDKLFRLRAEWPSRQPEALLREGFGSLLHLLRNALRLWDKPANRDAVATIGELGRCLQLDLTALQRLYALHYGDEPLRRDEAPELFDRLLALAEQALAKLDALDLKLLPVGRARPKPEPPTAGPDGQPAAAEPPPASQAETAP